MDQPVRVCVWSDARNAWECATAPPVHPAYWSANNSEAQVGAMQAAGPDPTATGGFVAYAEWLQLINPPAPERDPRD